MNRLRGIAAKANLNKILVKLVADQWPKPKSRLSFRMHTHAGMAELVDALDSKSSVSNDVRVRVPLPAPDKYSYNACQPVMHG